LQKIDNPLPGEDKTTRGIDIEKLEFDIIDHDGKPRKFYYSIWDFGGQQIYHSTHQFFLTCRSLYILVLDSGKDIAGNEDPTINYWLQAVELMGRDSMGKNSPLLIVCNQKNDRKIDINLSQKKGRFEFLEKEYNVNLNSLIKDSPEYNSKCSKDFKNLKEDIQTTLRHLPLVGFPMPKNSVKIRQELYEIGKTQPYISLDEYINICIKYGVTEYNKQLELGSVLHDLGAILHFKEYDALEDIVILQNLWVTNAAFALLDKIEINENKGRFTNELLTKTWVEKGYHRNIHRKLIALMLKFELFYKVDDGHDSFFIIPEMLSGLPPSNYQWQPENDLLLEYRYDFMPKGLLTRFIVRLNKNIEIENDEQIVWKNGVKLDGNTLNCPNTKAEIQEKWDYKQLNIRVQGSFSKEVVTIISHEIDKLNEEVFRLVQRDDKPQKSPWSKMIPCNCTVCKSSDDKHYYDYMELIERKEYGKNTIECRLKPYEEVDINSLIEGVFSEKKNLDNKMQMNIAGKKKLFISYSSKDSAFMKRFVTHLSPYEVNGTIAYWHDRMIESGSKWDDSIKKNMEGSDIIIFLISPDLLASNYVMNVELLKAIELFDEHKCKLFFVQLKDCMWEKTKIADYQHSFRNTELKEFVIINKPDNDSDWKEVLKKLEELLEGKL